MYVQQKLITPPPSAAASTQQQQQQQQTQQMMTWMMPLMFGFWSLNVPAGLALYWVVSNLSGIVFQYFYMGRRVDFRQLLRAQSVPRRPPPPPAPRDGRDGTAPAEQSDHSPQRPPMRERRTAASP